MLRGAAGVIENTGLDLRDNSYHISFQFMLEIDVSKEGSQTEQELIKLLFKNTLSSQSKREPNR